MKYIVHKALTFLFLLSVTITLHAQKNYFVSPSGSDSNAGTLSAPFKTVQKACNSVSGGDTINIMAGTYNEMVAVYKGGDSTKGYVTIRNYQNDTVIIDGTGLSKRGLMTIYNQNYIRISGLIIQNAIMKDAIGFLVEGACKNIIIENNVVRQIFFSANASDPVGSGTNSHPVLCNASNATTPIQNLKIVNNQIYNCRTGYSEALTLNGNVDGFLLQGNCIHDITNIGIDIAGNYGICSNAANDHARNGIVIGNLVYNCKSPVAAAAGIYVDGGWNVVIERNEVHNCQWGFEIGCEIKGKTTSGITLRDNIAYKNALSGITVGGYNYPSTGKVVSSSILNNTTFSNDATGEGGGELHISYAENCTFANNIFYNDFKNLLTTMEYQSTYVPSGLILDYNQWFTGYSANAQFNWGKATYSNFAAYQNSTGNDAHSIYANPLFVNILAVPYDLQVTAKSPAIDNGDPSFVPGTGELDKAGNTRVLNDRVDIGAYEFNGTMGINDDTGINYQRVFNLETNYPNPFNPATTIRYQLSNAARVLLTVYNSLGKEITRLVDDYQNKGAHEIRFDASNLPSGLYLYRLQVGNAGQIRKMLLIK